MSPFLRNDGVLHTVFSASRLHRHVAAPRQSIHPAGA